MKSASLRNCLALIVLSLATPGFGQTQSAPDPVIDNEVTLLKQIFDGSREGRLIGTTLRQSHDSTLTPLFAKLITTTKSDRQVEAFISTALVSHDPKYLDIPQLIDCPDFTMVGAGLAALIEAECITDDQLEQILRESTDSAQRVMVVSELNRRGKLTNRKALLSLAEEHKDRKPSVRFYAAVTLLEKPNPEENAFGLKALQELLQKDDPRNTPVISLMMVRIRKDKLTLALPWVKTVAASSKVEISARFTAISTLLALDPEAAAPIYSELLHQQTENIDQIKLALIGLEHAAHIKPEIFDPLVTHKQHMVATLGKLAQRSASGQDITADLIDLLHEGHPILLDWALLYAERVEPLRQLKIREAIVKQAAIVDRRREQDFERAAIAAEKLAFGPATGGNADPDSPGRQTLKRLLASDNPGVVEACLLGLARSEQTNLRSLVLPLWTPAFYKKSSNENSANFTALILAREGGTEPLNYLKTMTETAENSGYRALAGWYYAKLTKQSDDLLKRVLTSVK